MEKKLEVVSIRLVKDARLLSERPICNPTEAVELLGEHMCQLDREVLCIINLKASGVPINCNFISVGAVDQTLAHPREIFKSCVLSNAASVLLLASTVGSTQAALTYYSENYSTREIAQIMDIPEGRLRERMRTARKMLGRALGNESE